MARGWDSKAVEEQIAAAEAEADLRARAQQDPAGRAALARRLSLERTRHDVIRRIASARNERYLEQLELALAHVDAEIATLAHRAD